MKFAKALKSRRENARNRRAFYRAIDGASPALRDELIVVAQQHGGIFR